MDVVKEQLKEYTSNGELLEIKRLLEEYQLSPDTYVLDQYSMLHIAAQRGHHNIIAFLLDKGANIDLTDGSGHTPLHFATLEGNLDCIKILLDRGANISATNTELMIIIAKTFPVYVVGGRTPLHLAAESGFLSSVQYLVEKGAKREIKDNNEYTAFHLASMARREEVAQFLNPFPDDPLVNISEDEFMWRWITDYFKTGERVSQKLVGNVEGMTRDCCVGCKHLLSLGSHHDT